MESAILDVPGAACGLLAAASAEGNGTGRAKRQLKPQGTRTPRNEQGERSADVLAASSGGPEGEEAHDGQIEGCGCGDEAVSDGVGPTETGTASFGDDGELDLQEYCKQRVGEIDKKVERIRRESNAAITLRGKNIHSQLQQTYGQMDRLSAQVSEGREHTEQVRMLVVAASHASDTRLAETAHKQADLSQKVDALNAMVSDILKTGGGVPQPRGAREERGWASTHAAVTKERLLEAVQRFAAEHAGVQHDATHVAGPSRGKSCVVKSTGGVATAARRADVLVRSLRGSSGLWRELDAHTPDDTVTRVFLGRDRPRAQVQAEVVGKRVVALLAKRKPQAAVFHRRREGVVEHVLDQVSVRGPWPSATIARAGNVHARSGCSRTNSTTLDQHPESKRERTRNKRLSTMASTIQQAFVPTHCEAAEQTWRLVCWTWLLAAEWQE